MCRTVSLQLLRRSVISTFEGIYQGLTARLALARNELLLARNALTAIKRAIHACADTHPERRAELETEQVRLGAQIEDCTTGVTQCIENVTDFQAFSAAGSEGRGYISNPNAWFDLLSADHLEEYYAALTSDSITPLGSVPLQYWRRLTRDPKSLAEWLDARQASIRGLIWALKAARNEALHTDRTAAGAMCFLARAQIC